MNVGEILALTGASRSTFYRWRSDRGFPAPIRVGIFDKAAVKGWWNANRDEVGRWPHSQRPD